MPIRVRRGDVRTHPYFERVRATMQVADRTGIPPEVPSSALDDKLYCMVPFIWTKTNLPARSAIRKTWGKRCDILKFFIDPIVGDEQSGFRDLRTNATGYDLPDDVVVVASIRRPWNACPHKSGGVCRSIWEKIWRSWLRVDALGDSDLAGWYVKVDSDSYLFPDNAKRYVRNQGWCPREHHYFGHVLRHRISDAAPMVAGTAVFFSRATLKAAADIFRTFDKSHERHDKGPVTCRDADAENEEVRTSVCLKEHLGVDAVPVLDEMGRELVSVGEIEDVLLWNRTEQVSDGPSPSSWCCLSGNSLKTTTRICYPGSGRMVVLEEQAKKASRDRD